MSSIFSIPELLPQITAIGLKKRATHPVRTAALAGLGGIFISMGGLLSLLVSSGMPLLTDGNPGLSKLLAGASFPLGLILVVFMGAELFTGNNAHLIPAALSRRISPLFVIGHWAWVWLFNFVGSLFFVYFFIYLTGLVDADPFHSAIIDIAQKKTSQSFGVIFLKGIGANWLVCLAVWLGLTARDAAGRLLALWWPVMAFVVMGFEHSIANMFYIPLGMMQGANISLYNLFIDNLLPATLGNIIGGAFFVGVWLTLAHRTTKRED